jgi:organic hydroperoxide reductase OsmC/OhrA
VKPLPHEYEVRLHGGPAGYAQLCTEGAPELRAAPPVAFDGPGDAWSPEHLLLAAVQACFLFTLRAVARQSRVEFAAVDAKVSGTVNRLDGVTRFTEIVLAPQLTVPAGTDHERVLQVVERTKKACLISASLAVPVCLQPNIVEARQGD